MTSRVRPFDSVFGPLSNTIGPQSWTSWKVVLQELQCVALPDSNGRKPYIWPALVLLDDFTKTTAVRVGVTGPLMQNVNVLSDDPLSQNMHAKDTVEIRPEVGNVGNYIFGDSGTTDPNSVGHNLILVVALLEHHDFEEDVIEAGYTVFQSALQEAIAQNALLLAAAIKNGVPIDDIVNDIKTSVNDAVNSALTNSVTFFGPYSPDESIGSDKQIFREVQSTSDFTLQIQSGDSKTQYVVLGQLQVGTTPPSSDLPPFDCASGESFPIVNLGSLSNNDIPPDFADGDATVDNVSQSALDLTSRHGSITINQKVDQHSVVKLTACGDVQIGKKIKDSGKIDNHSHATIVARGNVTIGQKIDQHSTADINSEGGIDIVQRIDQHSVAKLTAGTSVHIREKIVQHSTATIFAELGDINIDDGIDQQSTAYITSLTGSITIGPVDGKSVVTLRAPNGTITIKQKVAGGATVNYSSQSGMLEGAPDTSGGTVKQLPPYPAFP